MLDRDIPALIEQAGFKPDVQSLYIIVTYNPRLPGGCCDRLVSGPQVWLGENLFVQLG